MLDVATSSRSQSAKEDAPDAAAAAALVPSTTPPHAEESAANDALPLADDAALLCEASDSAVALATNTGGPQNSAREHWSLKPDTFLRNMALPPHDCSVVHGPEGELDASSVMAG